MTEVIFNEWLLKIDKQFREENEEIIPVPVQAIESLKQK